MGASGSRGVGHPDAYINVVRRTDRGDGTKWRGQVRYSMGGVHQTISDCSRYMSEEQAWKHTRLVSNAAVKLAADNERSLSNLATSEANSLRDALMSESAYGKGRDGQVEEVDDTGIAHATLPPPEAYRVHATTAPAPTAQAAGAAPAVPNMLEAPRQVECGRCEQVVVPCFDEESGFSYCSNCGVEM